MSIMVLGFKLNSLITGRTLASGKGFVTLRPWDSNYVYHDKVTG